MSLKFSNPIKDHYFSLKCMPQSTARQRVEDVSVSINPAEMLMDDMDSFGNSLILGHTINPHMNFEVNMRGTAVTGLECYEEKNDNEEFVLKNFSRATYPGDHLMYYYNRISADAPHGEYNRALYFMRCIYRDFSYCSGATSVSTTAENAIQLGQGVCQDYAHIMLAICRIEKMPARYVVGMMTGEGYSHAWVEVKCKNYWYGFDPTNNYLVDENYIKISHGRDFFDCLVNKGIYHNSAIEIQQIEVKVNEIRRKQE